MNQEEADQDVVGISSYSGRKITRRRLAPPLRRAFREYTHKFHIAINYRLSGLHFCY